MSGERPPEIGVGGGPKPSDDRIDVLGLTRTELLQELGGLLDAPYRATQILDAVHRLGIRRFEEMTVLPASLRQELTRRCVIAVPTSEAIHESADGTRKLLLALRDGTTVEAVDIPSRDRRTLCLSSQAGCALGCSFCVTGYWGAGRDLTAGEIVGQLLAILGKLPHEHGVNVVLMGMGEPLHNLDAVGRALRLMSQAISWRRMTVSTVGVVPGIRQIAGWNRRPNLAISLHAPDDERRSRLMPINQTIPLSQLLAALHDYPLERGRKITIEYLLIRHFNDGPDDAEKLQRLLRGLRYKVNLIPVNPDPVLGSAMLPPDDRVVEAFAARLRERGVTTTVRRRRGDDVSAACGQLRVPGKQPRGFRRSNLSF